MKVCVKSKNPEFIFKNEFDLSIDFPIDLPTKEISAYIYSHLSEELQDCLRDTHAKVEDDHLSNNEHLTDNSNEQDWLEELGEGLITGIYQ